MLDKGIVQSLNAAFTIAGELGLSDDAIAILRLFRTARPDLTLVRVSEAMLLLQKKEYKAVRELMEEADTSGPPSGAVKAVLAFALFKLGDATWESYAEAATRLDIDADTRELVDSIYIMHRPSAYGLSHGYKSPDAKAADEVTLGSAAQQYIGIAC